MPGTIRKRGTSWQALLSYRDPKTGRQTQVSATRPTKRDAEIALAEMLLRRDQGRQPGDGRQKFNELVDTWLEFKQRTAQPSSLMRYDSALRVHLRPTFGAMALRSITPARIDAWYAAQHAQGLSDNSVRQHHDLLSNILRYAVRTLKWLPSNPADDANPPKRASTVVHLPDAERLAALIGAADDDGLLFGTFVRMIVCTGARRSEICALQWKHVDLVAGRIAVQASIALGPDGFYRKLPKSGRVRTIALPSAMVDHLALYRSYRLVLAEQLGGRFDDDCYLFDCHPEGRRTGHPGTMSEKFQTAKRVAGMKEIRLHDLRHHAATVLLNNRVSPRVVAERLGHTRVSTTLDIYAQFIDLADDEAAAIMGAFIAPRSSVE
jgi:integrase